MSSCKEKMQHDQNVFARSNVGKKNTSLFFFRLATSAAIPLGLDSCKEGLLCNVVSSTIRSFIPHLVSSVKTNQLLQM